MENPSFLRRGNLLFRDRQPLRQSGVLNCRSCLLSFPGETHGCGSKIGTNFGNPGKMDKRLHPAVPWWFNFDPHPKSGHKVQLQEHLCANFHAQLVAETSRTNAVERGRFHFGLACVPWPWIQKEDLVILGNACGFWSWTTERTGGRSPSNSKLHGPARRE